MIDQPFEWIDGVLTARASGLAALDELGLPIVWTNPEFTTLPPETLPTWVVTVSMGSAHGRATIQARSAQEALTVLTDDHDLGPQRAIIVWLSGQPEPLTVTVSEEPE